MEHLKQNLRTLSILYYVLAGIMALFSLFPLIHVAIGIMALTGKMTPELVEPPKFEGIDAEAWNEDFRTRSEPFPEKVFGGIFLAAGSAAIIIGESLAFICFLTGRKISKFRSYTFCMVGASISCLFMPLGTVLGVFTIINLNKPEARQLFQV